MRRTIAPVVALIGALVAVSCASGHTSQTTAKIPKPEIVIIQRTNLAENIPTIPTGINVRYEFQITNKAAVPITLKRIDFDALPGGGFEVRSRSRPYDTTIPPGTKGSVDFFTDVYIDPRTYSSQAPVAIRAQLLFDSPEGSLQIPVQTRVSANSGD